MGPLIFTESERLQCQACPGNRTTGVYECSPSQPSACRDDLGEVLSCAAGGGRSGG